MSALWTQFKLIMRQTSFRVAFIVLLVAAAGLNGATRFMQLYFKKLPVPLRHQLDTLPTELGKWVCVVKNDELNNDDLVDELGTRQFIFRDYVDSAVIPHDEIDQFEGKGLKEQRRLLALLQARYPAQVVNCAVTYYTGKADTVAHIPERCFVANGYQPTSWDTVQWDIKPVGKPAETVEVRYITFEDEGVGNPVPTTVAYFFQTDGHYQSDPAKVRVAMQNLLKPRAYYAKVELQMLHNDPTVTARVMRDFLADGLPEIERLLPTEESLAALNH